jgi:hypothetical protein
VTFRYYTADTETDDDQDQPTADTKPKLHKVSELSVESSRKYMHKWHDQGGLNGHSMWVHVPATNVRILFVILEILAAH